jgi:hypothetical protein
MGRKAPRALLAGKLFIHDDTISKKLLRKYEYSWEDREWEKEEDEDGNPVLKKDGTPKFKAVEVERHLTTRGQLWTCGGVYHSIPRGDMGKIEPWMKANWDLVQDVRSISPLGYPLKLKKKVRKDDRWKSGQKQCVKDWCNHGYGIVTGDTGSGKTVIGAGIICKMGLRTLIISKRTDGNRHWINQIRKLTNIRKLEREYGVDLIGAYSSKKRRTYPITVATIQSFVTSKSGWQDLIKLQNSWGLLLADECHELVTERYKIGAGIINAAGILGLTATDKRDDGLHFLEYDLYGPVVSHNKGRKINPGVYFIHTGVRAPTWIYRKNIHPGKAWHICMQTICKNEKRNNLIEHLVMEDIEAGYRVAIISPQRREPVQEAAKRLRQNGYKVAYVDGQTKNRDKIYSDVDKGKYDVLCAGRVMNALVDIQTLNCIHMVTPYKKHSSTHQVYGRARELDAVIRDYADEGGQLGGSVKSRVKLCEYHGWEVTDVDMRTFGKGPLGMDSWSKDF